MNAMPPRVKAEIRRELQRLELVPQMIKAVEKERNARALGKSGQSSEKLDRDIEQLELLLGELEEGVSKSRTRAVQRKSRLQPRQAPNPRTASREGASQCLSFCRARRS